MKMPSKLGAASRPRSASVFTKTDQLSWRENAPSHGSMISVLAMTALMSMSVVAALFIMPHFGQHTANTVQEVRRSVAEHGGVQATPNKITAITAEHTGRKGRIALTSNPTVVADDIFKEVTDILPVTDPRWAQMVVTGANAPLKMMTAIPGAEKVVAKDSVESEVLTLVEPYKNLTVAIQTIENKTVDAETAAPRSTSKPVQKAAASGREIKIKRSVNMRAKPGGVVLEVIPASTSVELVACSQWCEIVFHSQHGFIYKSYVQ